MAFCPFCTVSESAVVRELLFLVRVGRQLGLSHLGFHKVISRVQHSVLPRTEHSVVIITVVSYSSDPQPMLSLNGIKCAANFCYKLYLNIITFTASNVLYVVLIY
jgi:hypothetical protein